MLSRGVDDIESNWFGYSVIREVAMCCAVMRGRFGIRRGRTPFGGVMASTLHKRYLGECHAQFDSVGVDVGVCWGSIFC